MSKRKILIVEDNELNLKLFHDLLEMKGVEVVATKDGASFYELTVNIKPDLILMDIQLQGKSGLDLIAEIKADEITKKIPVIAITAFAMKDDEEKIMQSGCEAYLSKPITIEHFFSVVNRFIDF